MEPDAVMIQHSVYATTEGNRANVWKSYVMTQIYSSILFSSMVFMEGTSGEWTMVDIGASATKHQAIITSLLTVHVLTECDTVARHARIVKVEAISQLGKGTCIKLVG